ncbi:MAG: alanine-glyoxylate transaminase / serine-glyoxylate transaminase / serine-pyruvate transaminase [Solirubrobacteraceae bacterium]|jgi:alanine-glyoxylate transaminase/serine-glyoxylate transaminase/serine-pyruvate transaminase|nr:alanine-glyoxylate transaminase / serine-glyoxylate transaminase / serine-pyruvate transaminase [Solirubrobacteraceae bacterium]
MTTHDEARISEVVVLPERLLLGSGPSPVPERVLAALARPTIGHLDPAFGALMEDMMGRLRRVMVTENRATLAISGTGSAGMQTMVDNFVAPGDRVVCGVHGLFGERMSDALSRRSADVVRVEAEWGRTIPTERLTAALDAGATALFVVHGETSTGVCQPLDGLAEACREHDALFLVDCVTSLAGQPLELDGAGVDVAFSGTQKCLNCPPGLAPFTISERAVERLLEPSPSWYFDLRAILAYWREDAAGAPPRAYHHTAPINMVYALHEALAIVLEEGLPARWERHRRAHESLRAALAQLGFTRLAPGGEELSSLLAVLVPAEIDEAAARRRLLLEYGIEVSGGLGPLAGRVWRIGVMGIGAEPEPQRRLVTAVAEILGADPSEALAALAEGWG